MSVMKGTKVLTVPMMYPSVPAEKGVMAGTALGKNPQVNSLPPMNPELQSALAQALRAKGIVLPANLSSEEEL